jgi:acyl carrier protein
VTDRTEILSRVNDVFREVLDDSDLVLHDETQAADVAGWDSLSHIQLVVAMEKRFKIKFGAKEVQGWKNVGEMIGTIQSKVSG